MSGKQGATWDKPMTREQRDSIALTKIEKHLDSQVDGKKRLSSATLAAIKIRYDKLRPALSSIEQTTHNADDLLTEDQILAKFQALIQAFPDVLPKLLALQAKGNPGITEVECTAPLPTDNTNQAVG